MNWYKKAQISEDNQQEFPFAKDPDYKPFNVGDVDITDSIYTQTCEILQEFIERKHGDTQSWNPVSFAKVQKIWRDYARLGVVRDIKGLEEIVLQTIENIARLYANTELCGHGMSDPESEDGDFASFGLSEKDKKEFWDVWTGSNISDYAMEPLLNDAIELIKTRNANEALLIVDRIFNRVHQRGDLASIFIEGGEKSLWELFEQ